MPWFLFILVTYHFHTRCLTSLVARLSFIMRMRGSSRAAIVASAERWGWHRLPWCYLLYLWLTAKMKTYACVCERYRVILLYFLCYANHWSFLWFTWYTCDLLLKIKPNPTLHHQFPQTLFLKTDTTPHTIPYMLNTVTHFICNKQSLHHHTACSVITTYNEQWNRYYKGPRYQSTQEAQGFGFMQFRENVQ